MTELPGLYSTTRQWRHLRGRRLALDEPPRSPEQIRLAAWLELLYWWRVAFAACAGDFGPRGGYTSAKLIAEPARIWILLEHGEKHAERARALERAIELLPEEADSFRLGLDLHRTAAEMPPMRLVEVLPVLAQLSHRIVAILSHLAVANGLTEARLVGTRDELTPTWIEAPAPHPDARALCDWRGIVSSHHGDEWFVQTDWEATDPAAIHRATMLQDGGGYYALRSGPLFVFPGPTWERTRRRGIESTFSDPVTFALAAGHETAFFPNHPGFCLNDVTRRALAERRAWLQRPTQETTIADLLLAARAALIRESFAAGAPLIPVTLAATARLLAERSTAARAVSEAALEQLRGHTADAGTTAALRAVVTALPGLEPQ